MGLRALRASLATIVGVGRLAGESYFLFHKEKGARKSGMIAPCGFSLPGYSPISISPGTGIRVPTGSTRQFSASGKGITEASVTWSVSGSGCSKSACGTISDIGLYTAPVDFPNPAKVIVEAASRTDWSSTGKSEVTMVRADH